MDGPDAFQPNKLASDDLERPVTRNMRALPDAEVKALRAQRQAQDESFRVFNPRVKRRLVLYPIGAVLGMSVVYWFISSSFDPLISIPIFAVYGAYLAVARPNSTHAGAVTLLTYLAVSILTSGGFSIFASVIFACVGAAVGYAEDAKRSL